MTRVKSSIILVFLSICLTSNAQSALEIVKKMDENARGNTCVQELKIEIIRTAWKREMRIKTWSKGNEKGMMLIKEPVRDKGVSYLKIGMEAWNWQPSIDRSIKMPPSTLMQAWMGSDVTNDDLMKVSSLVVHYHHSFIKDSVVNGYTCYGIQLIPKDNAPVIWGKINLYITKEHTVNALARYYDEDMKLARTIVFNDIKLYGKKWYPSWQEVIPANQKGNKTITRIEKVEWDISIPDTQFSLQNLKRLN